MSAPDQHKNLAYSTIAVAPSPGISGLSLTVQSGDGANFPAVPFNVTVWPRTVLPTVANAEIARVTAIAGDTLTLVRTTPTESPTVGPRTIVVGDQIAATITKKTLTDMEARYLGQSFRGLHLRTHPDADKMLFQVDLVNADEIVMDDGERITGWAGQVADITVAGAGGLDTGAEGASRWYEIYSIAKEDGTKNLLLHRAKDYLLDQSFLTATNTQDALRNLTGTSTDKLAQGVTFATAGVVPFIDVQIDNQGVTGNIWVTLEADAAGSPSGTPLATSDKLNAALVATTGSKQWVRFIFRTPATVTAALYHLVLQGDYARSDTVRIRWVGVTAGGYAGGVAKIFNGTTWSATANSGDFLFRAYVTENDTAVTMPTGYTKKCKVGYVYNDSGSNFVACAARDKQVTRLSATSGNFATIAATTMTLSDLSAMVPPGHVRIGLGGYHDTNAALLLVGGVPDGLNGSVTLGAGTISLQNPSGGNTMVLGAIGTIDTETQACYARVSSGNGFPYLTSFEWSS